MKKVLIVGGGLGGLATAVRLLSKGYEVSIFEKESSLGGKTNCIKEENFRFDLTASILMTFDIYEEVFKDTGKNIDDYLKIHDLDILYRAIFSDGSFYDFYKDTSRLVETLLKLSKEDLQGYIDFLERAYKKYVITNKYFLNKNFNYRGDFFNFKTMYNAIKLKTLSSSYGFIKKYIKSEKLRKYLCFQSFYVGVSPYTESNIYTMVPAATQVNGLKYIEGGFYSYVEALEKIIKELKGKIYLNTNINEIVILKDRVLGVREKGNFYDGDIVICNADYPYAMETLISKEKHRGKYKKKKIKNMDYSCSTFIIHIALKKKYPKLKVHNVYIGEKFKEAIEDIFKGKLPEEISLYIYCPSSLDDTLCKNNEEILNIMLRVPNLKKNNIVWDNRTIKSLRDKIFLTLKNIEGLEDIEENIIYENYTTPLDFLKRFNSYFGSAFGLSNSLKQSNYFRPSCTSKVVENLYFVGASVQPGPGASIVLNSSKQVFNEIYIKNKMKP